MSEQNVELARRAADRFNAGDMSVSSEIFHPDIEFLARRSSVEGPYLGLAGIETFFADTFEVFEKFEFDFEYEALGEHVLAWGTIHVRAKGSGLETDIPAGGLFNFRDGKIVRWQDFGSREAALEAAETG
jgi:ketosteroid isomerase-like protein